MSMVEIVDAIAKNAERKPEDGDYTKDGLLHCGKCKTPKECYVELFGETRKVGCLCKCETEQREKEEAQRKSQQEAERIKRLRVNGIIDRSLAECTFETAEMTPELQKCKRYVDHWDKMRDRNTGLLLWGNVGGGKTFAAACIVNALIDKGVSAMITSFPRILSGGGYDKSLIAQQMRSFDLVVIDDLGAERESDYALETVFMVIDERIKSGKPLIVTTNLTMDELKSPKDEKYNRIYDRVRGMCVPLYFSGRSKRDEQAEEKRKEAAWLLMGDE